MRRVIATRMTDFYMVGRVIVVVLLLVAAGWIFCRMIYRNLKGDGK
jgi:flagellar biogenesis protein FliO